MFCTYTDDGYFNGGMGEGIASRTRMIIALHQQQVELNDENILAR